MISKERLEELIKEGATIYTIKHNGGDVFEVHLKNISDEYWYFLLGITEELFENKAEVEEKSKRIKWALKYHATRTEELDLPTWEEWCENIENDCETIIFSDTHYNKYGMFVDDKIDENIIVTKYLSGKRIVFKPNTEENYEKACELCLKLFKGEKE